MRSFLAALLAYFFGRQAGAAEVHARAVAAQAETAERLVDVREHAPATRDDIVRMLDAGKF